METGAEEPQHPTEPLRGADRAEPATEYRRRLDACRDLQERVQRGETWISRSRGILFLAILVASWGVYRSEIWWGWPLVGVALFVALMVLHDRVIRRLDRIARTVRFYEHGCKRLQFDWSDGDPGAHYLDDEHPYARDLDLFGKGSLFQLVSQARTRAGKDCLARWLQEPAEGETIRLRHGAVRDLASRLPVREQLAVVGEDIRDIDVERLKTWSALALRPLPKALHYAAAAATAALIATIVLAALEPRALPLLGLAVLAEAGLLLWTHLRITPSLANVSRRADELQVIAGILAVIEDERFTAPHLVELQERLLAHGTTPSAQVARLGRLVSALDWQRNQFFLLIAVPLLWQLQLGLAIYRWRHEHGASVLQWLETIGAFEALSSIASYAFEHPDCSFPVIEEGGPVFAAEALGHPLLAPEGRVCNDITFGTEPRILVVSGSNMSGKSTMLRTVGINAVLALAGAPVAATQLRLSPVQVAATLHIQDSLLAGRSRFFAEILRLQQILELTRGARPVLFLIDEILHGTNSHDRQIGGTALIRSLLERGAIGLVSTHDLAFSTLADDLAPRVMNVHFADTMRDGNIEFDYKMKPGTVQHSNALELMRSIGIEM